MRSTSRYHDNLKELSRFCTLFFPAMIIFRVLRHQNKFYVKLVHFGLQLVAFGIAVWGVKAVFDFHNHMGYANLYSVHSWCGLSTVILFGCQVSYRKPFSFSSSRQNSSQTSVHVQTFIWPGGGLS